jgi:DNA repair ATPase RecN
MTDGELDALRRQFARVQALAERFRGLAAAQLDEVVRLREQETELWEARAALGHIRAQLEAAREQPAQLHHTARRLKAALISARALVHEWRSSGDASAQRCADALERVLDHAL